MLAAASSFPLRGRRAKAGGGRRSGGRQGGRPGGRGPRRGAMMRRTKPEVERYVASVQAAAPSPREVSAAGGGPRGGPRTGAPWPCSSRSRRAWRAVPAAGATRPGPARPVAKPLPALASRGAKPEGRLAWGVSDDPLSLSEGRPLPEQPGGLASPFLPGAWEGNGLLSAGAAAARTVSGGVVLELGLLCLRPWKSQRRREL